MESICAAFWSFSTGSVMEVCLKSFHIEIAKAQAEINEVGKSYTTQINRNKDETKTHK